MAAKRISIGRFAGNKHNEGNDDLAVFTVRFAHHGSGLHGRVSGQPVLDLARVDVEPRTDDLVFVSADDEQVTVFVDDGKVAGAKPAIAVEHHRGGVGIAEIAKEHVVAAGPDFADVANERIVAELVDQAKLDTRQRTSDRRCGCISSD